MSDVNYQTCTTFMTVEIQSEENPNVAKENPIVNISSGDEHVTLIDFVWFSSRCMHTLISLFRYVKCKLSSMYSVHDL
jgi:hypothetical protein